MSAENPQQARAMERLGPYVHPDHWDGHTFGQGEITEVMNRTLTLRAMRLFAQDELADYLNAPPDNRFALQTYTSGDTFNPDSYNNGAIVAFREEHLFNARVERDISIEGVEPAPVYDLLPSSKDLKSHLFIHVDFGIFPRIQYQSIAYWGIIARRNKKQPASLVPISPTQVKGVPPEVQVKGTSLRYTAPITIGAVHHLRRPGYESISRVNRLEVCTNGTPEQARQPLFSAFSRFATNSGLV